MSGLTHFTLPSLYFKGRDKSREGKQSGRQLLIDLDTIERLWNEPYLSFLPFLWRRPQILCVKSTSRQTEHVLPFSTLFQVISRKNKYEGKVTRTQEVKGGWLTRERQVTLIEETEKERERGNWEIGRHTCPLVTKISFPRKSLFEILLPGEADLVVLLQPRHDV